MDLRIQNVKENIIRIVNDSGLPATVICYILNELLVQANEVKISSIKNQEEQKRKELEEQQRQEQIRQENDNQNIVETSECIANDIPQVCDINDPSSCTTNVSNVDYDKTAIIET